MKKPIFDGCVFGTAGTLKRNNIDITKAIKDNGGTVSYLITKKTTHLLTTTTEVELKTTKIKSAQSYGAHILLEDFLWDSIAAQQLLDVARYTILLENTSKPALSAPTYVPHTVEVKPSTHAPTVSSYASKVTQLASSVAPVKPSQTSTLDPQVKELIEYIYSQATSEFNANFDAKITPRGVETPLGVLSSFQIDKGERVLREINQILKTSEEDVCSNPKLELLSSQFYTTIPQNIGKSKEDAQNAVIRTLPHLRALQEHLQLMRDILAASSTGALVQSELDVKYKALKCDIQPVSKGSSTYAEVQNQVLQNQPNNTIEIVSIYKIKRANEHERFTKSMANQKTLLHGTSVSNVVGVLSRGLLPPKTVVGLGGKRTDFGWLGSGIYFAPDAESFTKFTTQGKKGTRMVFVATVALGTVKEYDRITPTLERPPMGYHSTHGKPGSGSEFTRDEYAIYKPEQQKLEYLVEFKYINQGVGKLLPKKAASPKKVASPMKAATKEHVYVPAPSSNAGMSYVTKISSTAAPSANLTAVDKEMKSKEDHYRNLFVNSRNDRELNNPHLALVDISNTSKFMYNNDEVEYPLILQAQRDARKRSGCAVVSPSQFKESFDTFTKNQFKGMDWNNVFVAGGCVLASMLQPDAQGNGYKSSDVDMFFYGINEHQANQKLKDIYELVKNNTQSPCEVIRTKHAVTIVNQFPFRHIQIVLRLYKSPAEILMGFDIDSCAVGYDGKNAYALERACRAITRGYNLVDMSRRSLTYESRLFKYSKRGFAVAIPGFDRNKVNPEIFNKSVKDVKGLAQLLLFEFNSLKNSATKNPFKSNKVPATQIRHPDSFTEDRLQEFETLRANKELPDSDYSSVYIPWGPQWFAKQILNLLNYQDKAQFFAKKNNIRHRHIFVSGIQGVLEGKSFWCRKCKDEIGSGSAQDTSGEDYVAGPLRWLQDNPGRQLLTGSFHPVTDDEWEIQAYRPSNDAFFALLDGIFTDNSSEVARNASAQAPSDDRMHPLLFAALLGRDDSVEALLRAGVRHTDVKDARGLRAIHYAAASGNLNAVRAIVRNDSTALTVSDNEQGLAPLHIACYYGRTDVAQHIVDQVGDQNDARQRTPLHYAALGGSLDCCKLFLKSNQDAHLMTIQDNDGLTPLTGASRAGHQGCLDYFLSLNPYVNASSSQYETITSPPPVSQQLPVLSAVARGTSSLTSVNGDFNESDAYLLRPLHVAATLPAIDFGGVLKTLMDNGSVDKNCTDIIGQTPAHYAVLYGNLPNLTQLAKVSQLAKPNLLGQTPLYYAKMLLGTFSGFRNEFVAGLPEPRFRRNLEEIVKFLQPRTNESLSLSPYPLPPIVPSEYLSVASPLEQQLPKKAVQPAPAQTAQFQPSLFSFSNNAPSGVAGKFDAPAAGFNTFGSVMRAQAPKKATHAKAYDDEDYSGEEEEEEDEDEDEEKPKYFGKKAAPKKKAPSSLFATSSPFGSVGPAPAFGQPVSAASFGQPVPAQATGFVKPATFFGQPVRATGFGQNVPASTTGFGQPVGAQTAGGFGKPGLFASASSFGAHATPAPAPASFGDSVSGGEPPSAIARVLVLISLLNKGRNIGLDEKGALKDAALSGNPLLLSALECYEIDGDLEEFADTASRIIALSKAR